MKHHLPIIILFALVSSSLFTSISNYYSREALINSDVQNALSLAMRDREYGVVDADTIQAYRNLITIDEVKDTASINVKTINRDGKDETVLEASAGCSFLTILSTSDQRASSTLAIMAILWAMGSFFYTKRQKNELVLSPVVSNAANELPAATYFGNIRFNQEDSRFITKEGEIMRFTPMQQKLMEMFFDSPSHSLAKQDICDALWPKKPDASDTLYTLIRRLKPIIEEHTNLKIESDRGRDYILTQKD